MRILIVLFILLINSLQAEWRGYDVYRCGAKGLATGGAFTAIADDVSALYYNPAGLVQVEEISIFYTLDSQLKLTIIDPTMKITYMVPALIGCVIPFKNSSQTVFAISAYSPFQRKIPNEFAVYKFAPQIATRITDTVSAGCNIGFCYATYDRAHSAYGFGWSMQMGLLYTPIQALHLGISYQSKIAIDWGRHGQINDLQETFPDILTGGIAYLLTPKLIGSIDLEYQNWQGAEFKEDGVDTFPRNDLKTGFFKTIHPHVGIMFLEEKTGAHFRTGFYTDSFIQKVYDHYENKTQVIWTIGIGAYALRILRIEAALADSYLTHFLFKDNNQIETIQLTLEYRF